MDKEQIDILRVGRRVKFIDPESFDSRIGDGFEVRGRVVYMSGDILQIIVDGRTFAHWIHSKNVELE